MLLLLLLLLLLHAFVVVVDDDADDADDDDDDDAVAVLLYGVPSPPDSVWERSNSAGAQDEGAFTLAALPDGWSCQRLSPTEVQISMLWKVKPFRSCIASALGCAIL